MTAPLTAKMPQSWVGFWLKLVNVMEAMGWFKPEAGQIEDRLAQARRAGGRYRQRGSRSASEAPNP